MNKKQLFPLLVVFALSCSAASAHPFHASLSMVEWNDKEACFEVALRVDPMELQQVLARMAKGDIDLDHKNADKLIVAYLKRSFVVIGTDKKHGKLTWVGKEVNPKAAWLYFELRIKGPPEKARFEVNLFSELAENHVHTINLKRGRTRRSLQFKN